MTKEIRLIELDRDNAIKAFDMANETIRLLNFNKQTYKKALEAIAAMQDLDEPSIVRMCRMIAIAREALKDD